MSDLLIKRIYLPSGNKDGYRILVDRIWPRGIKKSDANIDLWLKEIAPSTELRKWFNHEAKKWSAFKRSYLKELESNTQEITLIKKQLLTSTVTLLYAAKDEQHNQAVILQEYLSNT